MAYVEHAPVWVPADLPVDSQGNTRAGYVCVHQLENGSGQCAATVFVPDQAIGRHGCVVADSEASGGLCVNPQHDHYTTDDGHGGTLAEPRLMTCAHDGRPTHYDEAVQGYRHDDRTPENTCFLIPDNSGGTPCRPEHPHDYGDYSDVQ